MPSVWTRRVLIYLDLDQCHIKVDFLVVTSHNHVRSFPSPKKSQLRTRRSTADMHEAICGDKKTKATAHQTREANLRLQEAPQPVVQAS
jgi:hypothetical protein